MPHPNKVFAQRQERFLRKEHQKYALSERSKEPLRARDQEAQRVLKEKELNEKIRNMGAESSSNSPTPEVELKPLRSRKNIFPKWAIGAMGAVLFLMTFQSQFVLAEATRKKKSKPVSDCDSTDSSTCSSGRILKKISKNELKKLINENHFFDAEMQLTPEVNKGAQDTLDSIVKAAEQFPDTLDRLSFVLTKDNPLTFSLTNTAGLKRILPSDTGAFGIAMVGAVFSAVGNEIIMPVNLASHFDANRVLTFNHELIHAFHSNLHMMPNCYNPSNTAFSAAPVFPITETQIALYNSKLDQGDARIAEFEKLLELQKRSQLTEEQNKKLQKFMAASKGCLARPKLDFIKKELYQDIISSGWKPTIKSFTYVYQGTTIQVLDLAVRANRYELTFQPTNSEDIILTIPQKILGILKNELSQTPNAIKLAEREAYTFEGQKSKASRFFYREAVAMRTEYEEYCMLARK